MFIEVKHPLWTNLKIFPEIAELERDIAFINEFSECCQLEKETLIIDIISEYSDFLNQHITKPRKGTMRLVYLESDINYIEADIIISPYKKLNQAVQFNKKYISFNEKSYKIYNKYNLTNFDNLVCLAMIVKDAGPNFENILTENLNYIDQWCILDTGSTDGTQETINRVLSGKKGKLHHQPFTNFRDSRNHCLDLAGESCKFILMLDDTYIIKGDLRKFLNEVRGDTFADSFSLMIQSEDNEYYSNRIIKSKTRLRYIHTIHEVITNENNINVTVPNTEAWIFDHRSDYMENRTINRKQLDLKFLFKELESSPDDPRTLYYIAQTYGCIGDEIKKADFFEKRILLEGYVQERIDAFFELARCYNFKVNSETKELMEPGTKLSDTQWERVKSLYIKAYSLDTNRPDSLYFIGIHHYLEKDYFQAYNYFKKAFELGYPINSQYSLKPTLSYHFLPKFLTEVCYYLEDYPLGKASAELFLQKNKSSSESWNLVLHWWNIHKQLINLPGISSSPKGKGIFCIVTDGGWEPWTGKDIETKGLGGSETWIIETAKNILNFTVVVFCNTLQPEMYNGVGYNPVQWFHKFISETVVEYCIISRYTEYVPVALKGHAKNVGVIFHDILQPELVLPIHPKLKWVFGLSEWHAEKIKQTFPQFNVSFTHYGIDPIPIREKIKHSFIYSSFPNRGLVILLRLWPKIKELFPDATLNVYCNLNHSWTNEVAPGQMEEIKQTIQQQGITNHGWVSKKQLSEAWGKTEYWLYPCIFEETFCLTALEAAISQTCVITNGLAALQSTAKYGIIVQGNPFENEHIWLEALKDNALQRYSIEKNYQWAKTKTWKYQTDQFLNNFM